MIRFIFSFGVLVGISQWDPFIANIREPYCEALASSLVLAFSLTSLEPTRIGATIQVGFGNGLTIVPTCDGLVLLFLFLAGVSAMPIQRTLPPYLWAVAFLVLLVIINWFRLATLALTSFYKPGFFEVMHLYVIQTLLILAVVVLFYVWLSCVDPESVGTESREAATT